MATVAFLESNTTGTGRVLARKALARGYDVWFLSQNPERYPFVRELMLHPRVVDTSDAEAILRALEGARDLAAVLSSSEYYLEMAARVARARDLPGASPEAIATCRDKWRLFRSLEAAGVSLPRTYRVTRMEHARQAWERENGPVVVKPASGTGSLGVRLHRQRSTFEAHIEELLAATENERGLKVEPVVLVQELVEGDEVSAEMLGAEDGIRRLGITAKHLGPAPHFLEVGHDFPAPLDPDLAERIEATVRAALEATGMTFGPTHTELRLRDGEPVVIEINPRLAGGMIPVLIDQALGIDVLEAVLDTFLGRVAALEPGLARTASIAFVIPEQAGRLEVITPPVAGEGIADVFAKAKPGDELVREGSFRDRIGHVIAFGQTPEESRQRAEAARDAFVVEVSALEGKTAGDGGEGTGRLRRTLHPEAMKIVRKPPAPERRRWELRRLAAIDEAHLLMLRSEKLLPEASVKAVLGAIRELQDGELEGLATSVAPRGTYLLYEGALIESLGLDLGGITHLGRSRNDINACLFRLRLRESFTRVYRGLWRLRSVLVRRAAGARDLAMPVYSQFQPGLPGTFAFYLLGVERALRRDQEALQELLGSLDTSPMGAGAGGGTTVAIRPEHTAELLGFRGTCRSALDAVASRDLALRLLAAVSISGMHITRLAQDFQLWTTREFSFFTLPDELAGGSSMMPQKKNPYLLEMIKGRATRGVGQWVNAVATMQGTPFSNSVEVGTEALSGLEDGLRDFDEAARLMALIVHAAEPNPESMARSMEEGTVIAAAVADARAQATGAPFRQVHHELGAAVSEALENGTSPYAAVAAQMPPGEVPDTPLAWAQRYEYGGGPGARSTRDALAAAEHELDADAAWLRAALGRWEAADTARRRAVDETLGKD